MKKVFAILAVAGMLVGMASCNKVCKCTVTTAGISLKTEIDITDYPDPNVKKCSDLNASETEMGITTSVKCR